MRIISPNPRAQMLSEGETFDSVVGPVQKHQCLLGCLAENLKSFGVGRLPCSLFSCGQGPLNQSLKIRLGKSLEMLGHFWVDLPTLPSNPGFSGSVRFFASNPGSYDVSGWILVDRAPILRQSRKIVPHLRMFSEFLQAPNIWAVSGSPKTPGIGRNFANRPGNSGESSEKIPPILSGQPGFLALR